MSSDYEANEVPRREQDGDIVVDAIVEASAFQDFIDVMLGVVTESRIHFNSDGLHATAVDPANIAMTDARLGTDAFESYDAGAVTIGVNLNRVADELSFANAGDLIRIRVDMETRKLKLDVGEHVKPSIGLIDPDTIRAEPDIPDLDLPNEAVIEPGKIKTAVRALDNVSDHMRIAWDGTDEVFMFHAQGDIDETRVEFGMDDLEPGGHFGAEVASLFNLDYMKEIHGAIPSSTEAVRIEFGDEFPTKWHYTAQDGALTVTNMCAPRVRTN